MPSYVVESESLEEDEVLFCLTVGDFIEAIEQERVGIWDSATPGQRYHLKYLFGKVVEAWTDGLYLPAMAETIIQAFVDSKSKAMDGEGNQ